MMGGRVDSIGGRRLRAGECESLDIKVGGEAYRVGSASPEEELLSGGNSDHLVVTEMV